MYLHGFQTSIEVEQNCSLPNLFYLDKERLYPWASTDSIAELHRNKVLMGRYRAYVNNRMKKNTEIYRMFNVIVRSKASIQSSNTRVQSSHMNSMKYSEYKEADINMFNEVYKSNNIKVIVQNPSKDHISVSKVQERVS